MSIPLEQHGEGREARSYALSSAARPFISLATLWPQVLALRFVDRVGKGIRGAMLAFWADEKSRGLVYGFHRRSAGCDRSRDRTARWSVLATDVAPIGD